MGRRVGEDNYHVEYDRRTTARGEEGGSQRGMFEHCVGYSQLYGQRIKKIQLTALYKE